MNISKLSIAMIVWLCLFKLTSSQAQFHAGLKTGVNLSSTNENYDYDPNQYDYLPPKTAIMTHLALFTELELFPKSSIIVELMMQNKGYTNENWGQYRSVRSFYVGVPVAYAFQLFDHFQVLGGLEVNKFINQHYGTSLYSSFEKEDLQRTETASLLGLRFRSKKNFIAEFRHTRSVHKVNRSPRFDVMNQVFQFSVGYQIL